LSGNADWDYVNGGWRWSGTVPWGSGTTDVDILITCDSYTSVALSVTCTTGGGFATDFAVVWGVCGSYSGSIFLTTVCCQTINGSTLDVTITG
jgi:hypothetical protein